MKLRSIIRVLNKIAPPQYAHVRDKAIGLQIGSKDHEITRLMVVLDITPAVVAAAIQNKVQLIVTHHALMYEPVTEIDYATPQGGMIKELITYGIAVFVAHTNLDVAPHGVNWTFAQQCGLDPEKCQVLEPTYTENLVKFIVYVPQDHLEEVAAAAADAGAGYIGNYSACSFRTEGVGTFRPEAGADPFIGSQGILEYVPETKFETIIAAEAVGDLLNAVRAVHPYEEIAYDLVPLKNKGNVYGLGLLGELAEPIMVNGRSVKKLAVCAGSGGSLVTKAAAKGAEGYITGEMNYHDQLLAEQLGLAVELRGHRETEEIVVPVWRDLLAKELSGVELL